MNDETNVFANFNPIAASIKADLEKARSDAASYSTGIDAMEQVGAIVPDSMRDLLTATKHRISVLEAADASGGFYLAAQLAQETSTLGFGFTHIPADHGSDHEFTAYVLRAEDGCDPAIETTSETFKGVRSGNREARAWCAGALAVMRGYESGPVTTFDVEIDK